MHALTRFCLIVVAPVVCVGAKARARDPSLDEYARNFTPHAGWDKHPCPLFDFYTGKERQYVVLTSSDQHYLPVLLNWLVFYVNTCSSLEHVRVICYDKPTEQAIEKWGGEWGMKCVIPEVQLVHHTAMWLYRVKVVTSFLDHGIDVVQTDSDAMWIKNPIPYLQTMASVAGSLGSFPQDSERKFGASLCMGWIYLKSDVVATRLAQDLYRRMSAMHNSDDQREMNLMLAHEWDVPPDFQPIVRLDRNKDTATFVTLTHGTARIRNVTVAFLPDRMFRRHCDGIPPDELAVSVVLHCLVHKKEGSAKVEGQKSIGTWQLQDNWESATPNKDTEDLREYIAPLKDHKRMLFRI
jgi:hypothetical protein